MEKLRVGIIGIGNMGSAHCANLTDKKIPDMTLTAVCDINPKRLEWAEKKYPDVQRFATSDELLAAHVCDVIIVATPHYDHPRLVIEGLQKGYHMMCEKPAGVYTKAVEEMNAVAEKSDKMFGIMFNQRTNPAYIEMKHIVESGQLGAIKRTNWIITDWYRSQAYYDSGNWRATWNGEGGGVLLNQCPHNLDLWQWICGMPVKVQAHLHFGKWHHIEVEDDVTAYVEYANGATGVFITSTADAPGDNRFEVLGTKGKLVCEGNKLTFYRNVVDERDFCFGNTGGFAALKYDTIEYNYTGSEWGEQHVGVLKAFAGAILRGEKPIADGKEGINGLTLSNAMHLSAWLGRAVDLPLDADLYLAELNKRRASSKKKEEKEAVVLDTTGSYGNK